MIYILIRIEMTSNLWIIVINIYIIYIVLSLCLEQLLIIQKLLYIANLKQYFHRNQCQHWFSSPYLVNNILPCSYYSQMVPILSQMQISQVRCSIWTSPVSLDRLCWICSQIVISTWSPNSEIEARYNQMLLCLIIYIPNSSISGDKRISFAGNVLFSYWEDFINMSLIVSI